MGGGDISHDGQRIALVQSSGESVELVVVARNGSRRERVTSLSPAYVYTSPRWSPDDRSIAIQRLNSESDLTSASRSSRSAAASAGK